MKYSTPYRVERGVGKAVKESGIPRSEIWITSKLWPSEYGEGKTMEAIDKMLERLQTDYIDLLYVHQPMGSFFRLGKRRLSSHRMMYAIIITWTVTAMPRS